MFSLNLSQLVSIFLCIIVCSTTEIHSLGNAIRSTTTTESPQLFSIKKSLLLSNISENDLIFFIATPYTGSGDSVLLASFESSSPSLDYCQGNPSQCLVGMEIYGDVITVPATSDFFNTAKDVLYISVVLSNESMDSSCSFSLNVFTTQTQVNFELNIPQIMHFSTPRDEESYYRYLSIHIGKDTKDLELVIVPLSESNNFEVFVSSTEPKPNIKTKKSERWYFMCNETTSTGQRMLVSEIPSSSPKFLPDKNWGVGFTSQAETEFYFTFVLHELEEYTEVMESVSMGGGVEAGESRYFQFKYHPSSSSSFSSFESKNRNYNGGDKLVFLVTTENEDGDPDLFVNGPDWTGSHTKKPGKENCQFCEAISVGDDELEIDNPVEGIYNISVFGSKKTNKFLVTVFRENGDIIMINDQMDPLLVEISAPETYVFFKFLNIDPSNTILFNVQNEFPFSNTIELYLSFPKKWSIINTRPKKGNNDAIGKRVGGGNLFYSVPSQISSEGPYYFSVFSGADSANISVFVDTNQTYTILTDGQEISDASVISGSFRYFKFDIDEREIDSIVTFVTHTAEESVSMFISCVNKFPRKEEGSSWFTSEWEENIIAVRPDDPGRVGKSSFFIGIYGDVSGGGKKSGDVVFSILAYSTNNLPVLREEAPILGSVFVNDSGLNFVFNLYTPTNMIFQLKKENEEDEVKVYMNLDKPSPTPHIFDFVSISYVEETIELNPAKAGKYYILVYPVKQVSKEDGIRFTLSVQSGDHVIKANLDTIDLFGRKGRRKNIVTSIPEGTDYVLISNNLVTGQNNFSVNPSTHNTSSFQWSNIDWPGGVMLVSRKSPSFVSGDWEISIDYQQDSQSWLHVCVMPFKIFPCLMQENIPIFVKLEPCSTRYCEEKSFLFEIDIESNIPSGHPASHDWYVGIEIFGGELGAYFSQNPTIIPSPSDHTWIIEGIGDIILELTHHSFPLLTKGPLRFSLYGLSKFDDTMVRIIVYGSHSIFFVPLDQLLTYGVGSGYTFFGSIAALKAGETTPRFTTTISSCNINSVSPEIYMNVETEKNITISHEPTEEDHEYESSNEFYHHEVDDLGTVVKTLVIKSGEIVDPLMYYIGLVGVVGGSEISLFAYYGDISPLPELVDNQIIQVDISSSSSSSSFLSSAKNKKHEREGIIEIFIPEARISRRFSNSSKSKVGKITYCLHKYIMVKAERPIKVVNFDTVCAMETYGVKIDCYKDSDLHRFHHGKMPGFILEVDFGDTWDSQYYKLGVVAIMTSLYDNIVNTPGKEEEEDSSMSSDILRLRTAYNSLWVIDGKGYVKYDWNNWNRKQKKVITLAEFIINICLFVIFGLVCSCLLCCFFSLLVYCFLGCIINFCCSGRRNWRIVPNVEFWVNFPMLVIDGFVFLFCCCRGISSITTVDLETPKIEIGNKKKKMKNRNRKKKGKYKSIDDDEISSFQTPMKVLTSTDYKEIIGYDDDELDNDMLQKREEAGEENEVYGTFF